MVKIRKCQWIRKPEKVRILSSRELTFVCDGEHHLVWTTDEDERITFSHTGEACCGIAAIFSLDQGLRIFDDGEMTRLELDFLGIRTAEQWPAGASVPLTVEKQADTISFLRGQQRLYSLTFPSIAASASISFWAKGGGQTTFIFS